MFNINASDLEFRNSPRPSWCWKSSLRGKKIRWSSLFQTHCKPGDGFALVGCDMCRGGMWTERQGPRALWMWLVLLVVKLSHMPKMCPCVGTAAWQLCLDKMKSESTLFKVSPKAGNEQMISLGKKLQSPSTIAYPSLIPLFNRLEVHWTRQEGTLFPCF